MSDESGRSKETSAIRTAGLGREVERAPEKSNGITTKQLAERIAKVNQSLNRDATSLRKGGDDKARSEADSLNPDRSDVRYWEKTVEWIFVRNHFPGKAFAAPLASTEELVGDAILRFKDINSWCIIEFKDEFGSFADERGKYPAFGLSKWKKFYYSMYEKKAKEEGIDKLSEEMKDWIENEVKVSIETAKIPFGKLADFWRVDHSEERKKPPHIFVYGKFSSPLELLEFESVIEAIKELEKGLQGNLLLEQVNVLSEWVRRHDKPSKCLDTFNIEGFTYWGTWFDKGNIVKKIPDGGPVSIGNLGKIGWGFENFKAYVSSVISAKRGVECGADGDSGAADDKESWDFGTVLGITDDGKIAMFSTYDFAIATAIVKPKNHQANVVIQPPVHTS